MKVGDLVRWTDIEECYHLAFRAFNIPNLSKVRKRGIIINNNGENFFVYWENGDILAQKPDTIEVLNESR